MAILHTCASPRESCKQRTRKRWVAEKDEDYCKTPSQQGDARSISEAGSVFKGFWLADLWLACVLLLRHTRQTSKHRSQVDHMFLFFFQVLCGCRPPPLQTFHPGPPDGCTGLTEACSLGSQPSHGLQDDAHTYGRVPVWMKIFTLAFLSSGSWATAPTTLTLFTPLNKAFASLVHPCICRCSQGRTPVSPEHFTRKKQLYSFPLCHQRPWEAEKQWGKKEGEDPKKEERGFRKGSLEELKRIFPITYLEGRSCVQWTIFGCCKEKCKSMSQTRMPDRTEGGECWHKCFLIHWHSVALSQPDYSSIVLKWQPRNLHLP